MAKQTLVLAPIKPNAGAQNEYRSELKSLTTAMERDVISEIMRAYDTNPNPNIINHIIQIRLDAWENYIAAKAPVIAGEVVDRATNNAVLGLVQSFKEVPLNMSNRLIVKLSEYSKRALQVNQANIIENVSLIKSIPREYHSHIERLVNEAMLQGRSRTYLEENLKKISHKNKNRVKLIARDQINKITSSVVTERQQQLGITKNQWHHSKRSKEPRQSHLAANGVIYTLKKGCKIDGEYIYPGQLIGCNCFASPVIEVDF